MFNLKTSEKILAVLLAIFVLISIYLAVQYFLVRSELKEDSKIIKAQQVNEKVVAFTQLFIDKVLSGQTEVSFDDRLALENSVRGLNDQQIFDQWQIFVKGGTGTDSQQNLTKLLKLLVTKISY